MIDADEPAGPLFSSTPSPRSENGTGFPAASCPYARQFSQPFGQDARFVDESHHSCRWCQYGQSCTRSDCRYCHHPDHELHHRESARKNEHLRRNLKAMQKERDAAVQSMSKLDGSLREHRMKETEALQREEQLQQDLKKRQAEHEMMEAEHDDMVRQLRHCEAELQASCAEKNMVATELRQELLGMQGAMEVARSSELSLSKAIQTRLHHAQQNHEIQIEKHIHDRCIRVEQTLYEELRHKNELCELSEDHAAGLRFLREKDQLRFVECQTQLDAKSLHIRRQGARLAACNVLVNCISGITSCWTGQLLGTSKATDEFNASSAQDVCLCPTHIETEDLWNLTESSIEKAVNGLGDDILQIAAGIAKRGECSISGLVVSELPHWQPWMRYGATKRCTTAAGLRHIVGNPHLQVVSDRFARMKLQPRAQVFYEEREYHPWGGGIAIMPADSSGRRSMDCGFFRAEVFPDADFESYEWELYMSWSPHHSCDYWRAISTTSKLGDADSAAGHMEPSFSLNALPTCFAARGADIAAGPIDDAWF